MDGWMERFRRGDVAVVLVDESVNKVMKEKKQRKGKGGVVNRSRQSLPKKAKKHL
jgi:ribosomal protein L21E